MPNLRRYSCSFTLDGSMAVVKFVAFCMYLLIDNIVNWLTHTVKMKWYALKLDEQITGDQKRMPTSTDHKSRTLSVCSSERGCVHLIQ